MRSADFAAPIISKSNQIPVIRKSFCSLRAIENSQNDPVRNFLTAPPWIAAYNRNSSVSSRASIARLLIGPDGDALSLITI